MKNNRLINFILSRVNIFRFKIIPDSIAIKMEYRYRMGEKLNLKNPQTWNEKLQWLKLYNRNPEYTKMVDKYEAKEYVSKIIGDEYIIPTLGVYNSFDEIKFDQLPNRFVLKCTHNSGGLVICKNKNNFNVNEARKKINKSLYKNYFYYGREWPYKNVKPKIIVEQYMEDSHTEDLIDYKLMCFNGRVECTFVCTNRYSNKGMNTTYFDRNWKKMPFKRHYPIDKGRIKKPYNYDLMIELAEKLSKDIPFVRVDFYEINNKVYFGELTFFPGSGMKKIEPKEWDFKLGKMLELPKKKRLDK